MSSEQDKPNRFEDDFYGTATVGERGQIVIPAEARKKFNIETGDKLLIMGARHKKGLMILKADAMREFMTAILEDLQRVEKQIQNDDAKPEETGS